MLLAVLMFAAALDAADPTPLAPGVRPGPQPLPNTSQTVRSQPIPGMLPPIAERTPNLYRIPEQCKDARVKVVDRFGRPVPQKLSDLPKGALMYAVDRRIDGCPVLVVVYGTPALDNPNPPTPTGPELATPAKHEDAPSNRR